MHVIATAGHVDHGKSTLVRALTGMEPDRWAEERRRGMTIDLGYVWTDLPSGATVAFVDVPGHARFIANMLAGVGPVPAVLFVVAADEGWRRQSAEHLAAVDALGVRHALLAVTRSDLADPAPAIEEARGHLAATSLRHADAVAVSGVTGEGLPDLRAALDRLVAALPQPDVDADVRLWVDRVFTMRGSGTVVTGTLGAGRLRVGDELTLGPGGRRVRVRALQALQTPVAEARPVSRVAVNLRGVDVEEVRRGDALVAAGRWVPARELDVRLVGASPEPLPQQLLLHVGSAAVAARVRPLGAAAGGLAARLTLAAPLPLRPGDRALLRDPGAQRVAAGVLVLDADPPPLRRRGAASARAGELARLDGSLDVAVEVARRGVVRADHLRALGAREASAPPGVRAVAGWLVADACWTRWQAALLDAVSAHARDVPLDPGLPAEAARRAVGIPDPRLLDALVAATDGVEASAGRLRPPGAAPTFPPAVQAALDRLRQRLAGAPFAAPEQADLDALGLTPSVLAAAVGAGLLLRVGDGVHLLPDAQHEALTRLERLPQPFTVSQAREALGTSRRVAVPLLEHLDRQRCTRRVDGTRREVLG